MALISGTVKDSWGVQTKRLVRAYLRESGRPLGETFSSEADGTWQMTVNTTDYVTVIVQDCGSGDPFYYSQAACLPFDGYITDTHGHTITQYGAVAISNAVPRFGKSALYSSGDIADVMVLEAGAPDFILGDTFTIELSIYLIAMPSGPCRVLMIGNDNETSSLALQISSGGSLTCGVTTGAANKILTGGGVLAPSGWHDIIVTCDKGVANIYVDAALEAGPTAITQQTSANSWLRICGEGATGFDTKLNGYINDLRITKGVNRYQDYLPTAKTMPIEAYTANFYGENAVILDNILPV